MVTGVLSMAVFVLLTVLSTIWIHDTNNIISPFESAFYTFLFCSIIYGVMGFRVVFKSNQISEHFIEIIFLNLTTALVWLGSFYSLKYIEPDLHLMIYISVMALAGVTLSGKFNRNYLMLIVCLIYLVFTYFPASSTICIGISALAGLAGACYSVISKKIATIFSVYEVLSFRFILVTLVAAILALPGTGLHVHPLIFYLNFICLALVSVVIPLYCFQLGLTILPVKFTMLIMSLVPALYCLFQFIFYGIPVSIFKTFSSLSLFITLMI